MNLRIALVADQYGSFEVRTENEFGDQQTLGRSESIEDCLRQAAMYLGHSLVIPISGPDTRL